MTLPTKEEVEVAWVGLGEVEIVLYNGSKSSKVCT